MKNRINEIAEGIDFTKQKLFEITPVSNTFFKYNEYSLHNNNVLDPCTNCPNNPMNNPFSSGFCHCILGNKIIY